MRVYKTVRERSDSCFEIAGASSLEHIEETHPYTEKTLTTYEQFF